MSRANLPTIATLRSGTFLLEDSNTNLLYFTSPVTRVTNSTCNGGTCTRLGSSNGSMSFTFAGTDVWLFGKPGGVARIWLDGTLVDVLDTSDIPNDGKALWSMNDMPTSNHTLKIGGLDGGTTLNLLIDAFGVSGTVFPPSNSSSAIPSEDNSSTITNSDTKKLTGIIVGSLLGFLSLVAIISLSIFLYLRHKRLHPSTTPKKTSPYKDASWFALAKRRLSHKPIVVVQRPSMDKEYSQGYQFESYKAEPIPLYQQPTSNNSVPRFVLPDSPPASRPTVTIPGSTDRPAKLSPAQFIRSKMPWSIPYQPDQVERQERTPLMEVATAGPSIPWRQVNTSTRQTMQASGAEFDSTRYSSSDGFSPEPIRIDAASFTQNQDRTRVGGAPIPAAAPIGRGDTFLDIPGPSSPPPPSFRSFDPNETIEPPLLDEKIIPRTLPEVPQSVAPNGAFESPIDDPRTTQESDRYGWRNGLEAWNQLGGVPLPHRGDPESPLDPGFRRR